MAEGLTWERFVNWHGGLGKNMAKDTAQEVLCQSIKRCGKGMGANKTEKSILRASMSGPGVYDIKSSFDKATNIHKRSHAHSTRSSVQDEMMLADLRKLRPFTVVSGRSHQHFSDIEISSTSSLDMGDFYTWLPW